MPICDSGKTDKDCWQIIQKMQCCDTNFIYKITACYSLHKRHLSFICGFFTELHFENFCQPCTYSFKFMYIYLQFFISCAQTPPPFANTQNQTFIFRRTQKELFAKNAFSAFLTNSPFPSVKNIMFLSFFVTYHCVTYFRSNFFYIFTMFACW